jgi:hypothetical protein
MQKMKLETVTLDYSEILDLYKIIRHYLQSMPGGEAKETAEHLVKQLESHTKVEMW